MLMMAKQLDAVRTTIAAVPGGAPRRRRITPM